MGNKATHCVGIINRIVFAFCYAVVGISAFIAHFMISPCSEFELNVIGTLFAFAGFNWQDFNEASFMLIEL